MLIEKKMQQAFYTCCRNLHHINLRNSLEIFDLRPHG